MMVLALTASSCTSSSEEEAKSTVESPLSQADDSAYLLAKEACENQEILACAFQGTWEWKKGHMTKARKLYEMACIQHQIPQTCFHLGSFELSHGNHTKAYKYLSRSCGAEHPRTGIACYVAGQLEERAGELEEMRNSWSRSCQHNYFEACLKLGKYEEDQGRFSYAKEYYLKVCEKKEADGCTALKRVHDLLKNAQLDQ